MFTLSLKEYNLFLSSFLLFLRRMERMLTPGSRGRTSEMPCSCTGAASLKVGAG